MYDFLSLKNIVCMIFLFSAVISLFLPHWLVDTRHCKQNWFVIIVILASCSLMIDKYLLGLFLISVLALYPIISAVFHSLHLDPDREVKYEESRKK